MTELQKMEYEYYVKHRDYLVSQKHNMENKFSQLLIYLSAWVFTISVWFFNIFKFKQFIYIILGSWFFSLLALISILFSFIYSIKAYNNEIKSWTDTKKNAIENCHKDIMKKLINLWLFFLILSIILLFIFYFLNFITMSDWNSKTFVEKENVVVQKNSEPVQSWSSPTEFMRDNSEEKKK